MKKYTRVFIAFGNQLLNVTVSLPYLSPVIKADPYFTDPQSHVYICSIKKSLTKFVSSSCK